MWGHLTRETDVSAATQHYRDAEKHLRAALSKNDNFRPARSFLVAVLWELGRREEAQTEMRRLLEARSAMASQHRERFQDFIQRSLPYKDPVAIRGDASRPQILERLSQIWQDAEKQTSP